MTLALAVLLASLLGSVHCVAMCGAFTCLYAPAGESWRASRAAHASYNIGRLGAYLLLGTLAGAIGASVDRAGRLAGVSRFAAIITAVMLMGWGMHALLVAAGVRAAVVRPPAAWQRAMGGALQRFAERPPVARAAATGLLTTLLPCGWLYAFVVIAAGTGSVWHAVMLMTFFWLGTLPMMLAAGVGLQRLSGPLRARLPMLSAATILLLGLLSLASHLELVPAAHWLHPVLPALPVTKTAAVPVHGGMPQ